MEKREGEGSPCKRKPLYWLEGERRRGVVKGKRRRRSEE